jgi:hypothetical protein
MTGGGRPVWFPALDRLPLWIPHRRLLNSLDDLFEKAARRFTLQGV